MDKKQCKALKLNKQQCIRSAHKDSEYCWQHRFSRLNEARWWNNTKTQAYITLISLILAVIAIIFGPTLWNQKEILRQIADINKKLPETIPPVLTKEDANRPLSIKEKELFDEYEKLKRIAEQENIKAQFSLNAQLSYAGALVRLTKYKEAESAYRTILSGHPDNFEAITGLGITLLALATSKEGVVDDILFVEACEKFKKATEIEPDSYMAYSNLGVALSIQALMKENSEQEKLFADAWDNFQKATDIKPDYFEAYNNWGTSLFTLAKKKEGEGSDKLFGDACENFKKASEIKPDYHEAYKNWGISLLNWAGKKKGAEREKLQKDAILELKKAEDLSRGTAAYNLGWAYCWQGDEEECRKWLKIGEEERTLVERQEAFKNQMFEAVRDKEWFKNLKWKDEK